MTIEAVNVKSGERKVYHARYAVGCDGGKSFVRKSLGKNFFLRYAFLKLFQYVASVGSG